MAGWLGRYRTGFPDAGFRVAGVTIMKTETIDAGVIGLGAMGANMARNLHHAGYLGRVWNRTPVRSLALAEETGVTVARSPAGLAQASDVILISYYDDVE